MSAVTERLEKFLTREDISKELEDMKEKVNNASATCSVLAYKLDLSNQQSSVDQVDKEIEELQNETNRLIASFTPE